jgi:peptidoglycan hydrolase-like protein with peptidoglycan-binding domain
MLKSAIMAGNARLDAAAAGGPSVKKSPPADDPEAVRRIQKALAALGFSMPRSFPAGPAGEPDGKYGNETYQTVISFQRREFPKEPGQWDGRCGKNTLGRMDDLLQEDSAAVTLPLAQIATSLCRRG